MSSAPVSGSSAVTPPTPSLDSFEETKLRGGVFHKSGYKFQSLAVIKDKNGVEREVIIRVVLTKSELAKLRADNPGVADKDLIGDHVIKTAAKLVTAWELARAQYGTGFNQLIVTGDAKWQLWKDNDKFHKLNMSHFLNSVSSVAKEDTDAAIVQETFGKDYRVADAIEKLQTVLKQGPVPDRPAARPEGHQGMSDEQKRAQMMSQNLNNPPSAAS